MDNKTKAWNSFAVSYIALSLLLITLTPFQFEWPLNWHGLKWYLDYQDFAQNVFLFFPFGAVLGHRRQQSIALVVLYGTALSMLIELIQLFDVGRTSNYCDVIANGLGTMIGALCQKYFLTIKNQNGIDIGLVFMLMPLCWFISMRAATQEFMVWLTFPITMVALSILKTSLIDNRVKWPTLICWLLFSLLPLIYISCKMAIVTIFNIKITSGILILIFTPLLISILPIFKKINYIFCYWVLLILTALILIADIFWFANKNFPIAWTVAAHLHWIDILMSILIVIFIASWTKSTSTQLT